MRIKRVEADSVADAMRELRRELGEQALILHTKYLQPKGVTGWFRSPKVEILGAVDEPHLVGARAAAAGGEAAGTSAFARIQAEAQATAQSLMAQTVMAPPAASMMAPPVAAETALPAPARGAERAPARTSKKSRKAAKAAPAADIIPVAASDGEPAASALGDDAVHGMAFAPPEWARAPRRARRIAFVGPTGAGKTTTLAKLAARAQLEHGRRIGLVTIDTYRIGAVPQLAAYAEILRVPLEVAHTPEDLSQALIRLNDRDVVFIDTIGRSPLGAGVDSLVPFMAIAGADEVHLVLSATTRPADSMRAARSFARLIPNRLVITKVDETEDHSALAAVGQMTGLPITWMGVGQEVPDDLQEATPARVGALLAAGCPA
jgi:flagellar biosynthesis protein FlhF